MAESSISKTGFVYDETMTRHDDPKDPFQMECPERISAPYEYVKSQGLLEKCTQVPSRLATDDEVKLVHSQEHLDSVKGYSSEKFDQLFDEQLDLEHCHTYVCDDTYLCASYAAGSTLNLLTQILEGKVDNGFSLVRPPGHHANVAHSFGFCYFNNTAIATQFALKNDSIRKVLILDWDVHHGNGTQDIFYEDPNVLYLSLHRFDMMTCFPKMALSNYNYIGKDSGYGFNINIPWNTDKMGDADYKHAFERIVMPIGRQFKPDLVIVSSGFDAAEGDPLGEYHLTSDMYAYMTQCAKELSNGKLLVILEGGYNIDAVCHGVASCIQVLLGDVQQRDIRGFPCGSAEQTVKNVLNTLVSSGKWSDIANDDI